MERAASIELAIWINQYRIGKITLTDAVNAAETITDALELNLDGEEVSWLEAINSVSNQVTPTYALLPNPGKTYGLSHELIRQLDLTAGVLALSPYLFLGQKADSSKWTSFKIPNPLAVLDPRIARQTLFDLTQTATTQLSQLELHGNRYPVEKGLSELRAIHLPPAISSRVKNDLEFAERIWIISQYGIDDAVAHASPSSDKRKIETLNQLKTAALELMAASSMLD